MKEKAWLNEPVTHKKTSNSHSSFLTLVAAIAVIGSVGSFTYYHVTQGGLNRCLADNTNATEKAMRFDEAQGLLTEDRLALHMSRNAKFAAMCYDDDFRSSNGY